METILWDFLFTSVNNGGQLVSTGSPPPHLPAGSLVISLKFSEKENRHLGKAFAKGFARGFFTLGLAPPGGKSDYDFSSEITMEIEHNDTRLGPYTATSSVKNKIESNEFSKAAGTIRHELTHSIHKEIIAKLVEAGIVKPGGL